MLYTTHKHAFGGQPLYDEPIMRALYLITSQGPPALKDQSKWSAAIKDWLVCAMCA